MTPINRMKDVVRRKVNYQINLRRGDSVVLAPVIAGVGRANLDVREEHLFHLLQRLHEPGRLLVDVGANIGQTLVKYIHIGGRQIRYFGFEPNPIAVVYVEELIRINDLENARVVPVALSDRHQLADLLVQSLESADSGASINPDFRDNSYYRAKRLVPVLNGDEVIDQLQITDKGFILKIDVEGAELSVLKGLEKTLRTLRPHVVAEILPPSDDFSESVNRTRLEQAESVKDYMKRLGFRVSRIGAGGQLDASPGTNDYLFVPDGVV